MIDLFKFTKDHTPFCVLGLAAVGCLGYATVRQITNESDQSKKIDLLAQNTISSTSSNGVSSHNDDRRNPEISLLQSDQNHKKTLAARKIQKSYRRHLERLAIKKAAGNNPIVAAAQHKEDVVESFDKDGFGFRIFPNGTKEWGRFDQENKFTCA